MIGNKFSKVNLGREVDILGFCGPRTVKNTRNLKKPQRPGKSDLNLSLIV